MNNKKTLAIVSVLLVVLLGGASLLYAKLGDKMKPDNLLIQNETGNSSSDSSTPGASTEDDLTDNAETSNKDTPNNGSGTSAESSTDSNADNSGTTDSSNEKAPFPAPDFTVYDRNGNAVRLSDFRGKPVVLNFWASWCGPCKSEMPDFEEIYQEYGKDIHFVMVNLTDGAQETMKTATTFLDNSGHTFPVYFDKDIDAAITYSVYAVPVTYFINSEGHLIAQGSGALDGDTIKRGIGMILE